MKYSRAYVEITNICNKNCSFCPKNNRPKRRMTEEEFTVVAKKLRGVKDYIYYHVMGEPLTHPQLCTFIKIANGMGFKSAVTTNGSLLGEKGDALIESGVYKVNISVHSFEDGTKEDYLAYINDCIDFADKASKNGILTVHASYLYRQAISSPYQVLLEYKRLEQRQTEKRSGHLLV